MKVERIVDRVRAVRVWTLHVRGLVACVLLLTAPVTAVCPLAGQGGGAAIGIRDGNGHPFRTPAGSPLEPVHRLALLSATRDSLRDGIALADIGDRLGFWIRRDPDGEVEYAGAIHGGAFSRFDLGGPDQALIEVHYRPSLGRGRRSPSSR